MYKTLKFYVTIYPESGGYISAWVSVDITQEEYDIILENYIDGYDIGDWDDTALIQKKIVNKAVEEIDWENSKFDPNELGDAEYDIEYPDEIIEAAEEECEDDTNTRSLIAAKDITEDILVDFEDLKSAFVNYLVENRSYSQAEAEFAAMDFNDPYDTQFIYTEYESTIELNGTKYEVRYCKTNFAMCGLFELADMKPFEFYMLFDKSEMPDQTVGSYLRAKKKYVLKRHE